MVFWGLDFTGFKKVLYKLALAIHPHAGGGAYFSVRARLASPRAIAAPVASALLMRRCELVHRPIK